MNRRVHLVFAGQVLSWLGDAFQLVALPIAIAVSGGGATQMSASVTTVIVARIIFTLFGGIWSDRVQPRTVMAASDAVRALAALALAIGFWAGNWSMGLIIVTAFAMAASGSFYGPAYMAWRTAVVPVERRRQTNGTLTSLRSLMQMLGPVLGGAIVGFAGAGTGFAVNAATYAASFVLVVTCSGTITRQLPAQQEKFLQQAIEGWQAVRHRAWLLVGVVAAGFYHIGNGAVLVLAPLLVAHEYGGAHAVGIVSAAEGLGGFLGAALGARIHLSRPVYHGWMPLLLMPLWAASFAFSHSLVVIAGLAAIGYAGLLFYDVHWETALQHGVPIELQGRVHSWDVLVSFVALPVGSLAAVPLSQTFGSRPVIAVAAGFLFMAALVPLFVPAMYRFTIERQGEAKLP